MVTDKKLMVEVMKFCSDNNISVVDFYKCFNFIKKYIHSGDTQVKNLTPMNDIYKNFFDKKKGNH